MSVTISVTENFTEELLYWPRSSFSIVAISWWVSCKSYLQFNFQVVKIGKLMSYLELGNWPWNWN